MNEYIDILNDDGNFAGFSCLKSEAHEKGLFHASVHIWIFDSEKKVLIQKRAKSKDVFPNLWDVSIAGHISAGELPIISAIREVEEEVGITLEENELHFIGTHKKKVVHKSNLIDNEIHHIYICRKQFEIDSLNIQHEEVSKIKSIQIDSLIAKVLKAENNFVPHGNDYYSFVFREIKKF